MSDDANTIPGDLNTCGGFAQRTAYTTTPTRTAREILTMDFQRLRDFDSIPFYRNGRNIPASENYVRNIVEKYQDTNARTITSITKDADGAVITTSTAHNLTHDDIVKIADADVANQINLDGSNGVNTFNLPGSDGLTGFYRV